MGAPNNWLIPPAVLYNNPGITREEFVQLLDETRTGYGTISFHDINNWLRVPWNFIGDEEGDYHKGIHGLAEILGLEKSINFKAIEWKDRDLRGAWLDSPDLTIVPIFSKNSWLPPRYVVEIHTGNKFYDEVFSEGYLPDELNVGDFWVDNHGRNIVVKEIIKQRKLNKKEKRKIERDEEISCLVNFFIKVRGLPFYCERESHDFGDLQTMVNNFPFFDPDFMYNWSQERGVFHEPFNLYEVNRKDGFAWKQKNGKYYLDISKLPVNFQWKPPRQDGYLNLVVSAEALKFKAWKLFAFHGYEGERAEAFLEAFPEAKKVHEKAVWDGYTSEFAQSQGMTINEFLRARLLRLENK
jgi:hypothetical protein